MDKPSNPVIVGVYCAALFGAAVAVCRAIGTDIPVSYQTAIVDGMLYGGLAAIFANVYQGLF